jgi:hypothetical protein
MARIFDAMTNGFQGMFDGASQNGVRTRMAELDHAKWQVDNDLRKQDFDLRKEEHARRGESHSADMDMKRQQIRENAIKLNNLESQQFVANNFGDIPAEQLHTFDFNGASDDDVNRYFDRVTQNSYASGSYGEKILGSLASGFTKGKRDKGAFRLVNGQHYFELENSDGSTPPGVLTQNGKSVEEDPNDPAVPISMEQKRALLNDMKRAAVAGVPAHFFNLLYEREGGADIAKTPAGIRLETDAEFRTQVQNASQQDGPEAVKQLLDQANAEPEQSAPAAIATSLSPQEEMRKYDIERRGGTYTPPPAVVSDQAIDDYVPQSRGEELGIKTRQIGSKVLGALPGLAEKVTALGYTGAMKALNETGGDFVKGVLGVQNSGQKTEDSPSTRSNDGKLPDLDSLLDGKNASFSPENFASMVENAKTGGVTAPNSYVKAAEIALGKSRALGDKQRKNLAFWGAVSGTLKPAEAITLSTTGYLNTEHLALQYGDDSEQAALAVKIAQANAYSSRGSKADDVTKMYDDRNKALDDIWKSVGVPSDKENKFRLDSLNTATESYLTWLGISDPREQELELRRNRSFYSAAGKKAISTYDKDQHGDFNAHFAGTMVGIERKLIGDDTPQDVEDTYRISLELLNKGQSPNAAARRARMAADTVNFLRHERKQTKIPPGDVESVVIDIERVMEAILKSDEIDPASGLTLRAKYTNAPITELYNKSRTMVLRQRFPQQ